MREKILECLGTFPKKTKLNLIELGSIDKEKKKKKDYLYCLCWWKRKWHRRNIKSL